MAEHRALLIENPARLSIDHARLKIEREGQKDAFAALRDIAVLVLHHPAISITHQALRSLAEAGAFVLLTNDQHLPCGWLWPWGGSNMRGSRLRQQIALLNTPLQGELWAQLVQAKIHTQASNLRNFNLNGALYLERLAEKVQPRDPDNCEAQAAAHYWKHFFGADFERDKPVATDPINIRLNYGYAVLRSCVGRELAAAGLEPALWLGHHNLQNPFCLADDFMEPFRYLVDRHVKADNSLLPFEGKEKLKTLEFIKSNLRLNGQDFRFPAGLAESVASFSRVLAAGRGRLTLPGV